MTFIPNNSMRLAAERGLELTESTGLIDPAAQLTAVRIMNGESFDRAEVEQIAAFFSENTFDRTPHWEKTSEGVKHMLHGGDAGKVWSTAAMRDQPDAQLSEDAGLRHVAELFFADGAQADVGEDGLVWKAMLPEGTWKIGPNGKPLKVIAGRSDDPQKAIGMQDLVEAFEAGAVPHVTVPKTHNDEVDENTGFVRKLKIVDRNGVKTLMGGHEFTDKEIGRKVAEGSIANTSVGIEFGYVRKDDGKKFTSVLRHNALTNRPFLGRKLPAFGLEEGRDKFTVLCAEFDQASNEAVDDTSTSQPAVTIETMSEKDSKNLQEATVPNNGNEQTETPLAPAAAPAAPEIKLDEHPDFIAQKQENAALQERVNMLLAKDREREADDYVRHLKSLGLDEEHGCTDLLLEVKKVALADHGEGQVLLAEGDQAPQPVGAFDLVKRILSKLPQKEGKLALQLSEQASDPLGQSAHNRPQEGDGTPSPHNLDLAEKQAAAEAFVVEMGLAPAVNKD